MLGIRRIDRYILKELLGPTVLGFSLYTFILLMNAFFVLAQRSIAKNLGWELTFRLFLLEIPNLLVLSIPMAVLLGCLIGVGRMSYDSEWVAIQGAGHGTRILTKPAAALGILATLLCLYVFWVVVPQANFAQRRSRGEIVMASNMAADLKPRTFYTVFEGIVLLVDDIRPGNLDGRLDGVFVRRQEKRDGPMEIYMGRTGNLYPVADGSGDVAIDLKECFLYQYRENRASGYTNGHSNSCGISIPAPQYLQSLQREPTKSVRDLGPRELQEEIRLAALQENESVRALRLRTARLEYHMRLALPIACLLFAVLAVPLGITRARSGKGAGFALSIGVLLVYWIVYIICRDQAARGRLPVWLGAWSGNLVMLPWCMYGIWKLRRPRAESSGILWPAVKMLYYRTARILSTLAPGRQDARRSAAEKSEAARDLDLDTLGGTSSRFIGRLDTYIGVQFLKALAYALLSSYLIFCLVEFKRLLSGAIENRQPLTEILKYFAYYAPGMIPYTIPISCLVGAVVAVTILNKNRELTAIKAGGISMRRATVPILSATLLICGIFYVVQDRISPATNRKKEAIKDAVMGRSPRTYGAHAGGRWVFGSDGAQLYHFRLYDEDLREFQGLDVFTLDRDAMMVRDHWFAASARWEGGSWELSDAWYRSFPDAGSEALGENRKVEEGYLAAFDPPEHFVQREMVLSSGTKMSEQMSVSELRDEIRSLRRSGYDTTRMEVAYWGKFAWPAAPLVMVLLGLPFAFRVGRRGSLYGLGVAILLVIVYWATFAIFNALGLETILPPFLAAWAPNILYGLLGTYMILYVRT